MRRRRHLASDSSRFLLKVLCVTLIFSAFFGSALNVKRTYAAATTVLLSDGFDLNLTNWVNTSNAVISGSQLILHDNESMRSAPGDTTWTDYTYIADVRITSGAAGIVFRSQDDDNYYMWQLNANGSLIPHKKVNGNWSIIKNIPLGLTINTSYRVMIEVKGAIIRTFINGGLIDTTTDTQFSAGKIGMRQGYGEVAVFDNIMVTNGSLLLSDDFGSSIQNNWDNTTNATVSNSQLSLTDNEEIRSKVGDQTWTNYVLDLDINISAGAAGVVFRSQDENNFYMWQFNSNGKLRLHKKVGGVYSIIKEVSLGLATGITYHVEIDISDSTFRTFINGGLIDSTTDSQFSWGKVGFRQAFGETGVFDNVYVTGRVTSPPSPGPVDVPQPVLKYSFENSFLSGSISDDSGNNHTGTIFNNGGLSIPAGRFNLGQGLKSTGGDQNYIMTPSLGSFNATTVAFWMKADDLSWHKNTTVFDSGTQNGSLKLTYDNTGNLNDNTRVTKFTFQVQGNQGGNYNWNGVEANYTRFGEHDSNFFSQQSSWTKHLLEHNWIHLALVYEPAEKQVTFYLNGKLDSTQTFATALNPVFNVGRLMASFVSGESFKGTIDDFTIYDEALNEEQVRRIGNFEYDLWANRDADSWEQPNTVIYVDGTNGNDNNSGTAGNPLRTIGAGLATINGDSTKLVIQPGTYHEANLNLNKSGTQYRPIIIEAAQSGSVFIDGSDTTQDWKTGWNAIGGNIYSHNWDYSFWYTLSSFPSGANSNMIGKSREMIVVNLGSGDTTLKPTISYSDMSNTANSFYVDKGSNQIYMHINQNPNTATSIHVPIHEKLLTMNDVQYVIMRGLTFQYANPYLINPAVNFTHSKHILIEDCTFRNIGGIPLYTEYSGDLGSQMAEDFVIRRIQSLDNGGMGIFLGFRMMNVLVEDAYILRNGWRYDWSGYDGADPSAVGKIMYSQNITYRRISVRDNLIRGLWFDNCNWNIGLEDSYVRLNKQGGMWIEINPQGIEVRNSAFSENYDEGLNITNSEGVILNNNIIYQTATNYGWGALSSWEPNQYREANGYRPGTSIPWNNGGPNYFTHNTRMTNNYVIGASTGLNLIKLPSWANEYYQSTNTANNKYYAPNGDNVFKLDNLPIMDWAGWKSRLPQDTTSNWLPGGPFVDDGTVTVGFEQTTSATKWSNKPLNIPVKLSKPVNKVITVDYSVTSGTAQSGIDYVIKTGSLFFNPLQREAIINIVILTNDLPKGNKSFTITLSSPNGASLGLMNENTVMINGN